MSVITAPANYDLHSIAQSAGSTVTSYQDGKLVCDCPQPSLDAALAAYSHDDYIDEQSREIWKAERGALVADIVVTVDGMTFDGDEVSQGRMARAVIASDSDSETTAWVLANNEGALVTRLQLKTALKLAGQAQTALWTP